MNERIQKESTKQGQNCGSLFQYYLLFGVNCLYLKALSGFLVGFVLFFPQVMTDLYHLYYSFSLFWRGGVRALVLKKEEKVVGGMGKPLPVVDSCVHPFSSGNMCKT